MPNTGEDDELRSLVLRLQKHSHTHTCRKDGRYRCRFDYPKNASDTTHLKRNIDVGNKARFYVLRRAQGAEMINPYNPSLLRAWGANMDIQMVGSVYGAAEYVCHYMCKDEPQQLRQLIATNLDKLPQNSTHFDQPSYTECTRSCLPYNRFTFTWVYQINHFHQH